METLGGKPRYPGDEVPESKDGGFRPISSSDLPDVETRGRIEYFPMAKEGPDANRVRRALLQMCRVD